MEGPSNAVPPLGSLPLPTHQRRLARHYLNLADGETQGEPGEDGGRERGAAREGRGGEGQGQGQGQVQGPEQGSARQALGGLSMGQADGTDRAPRGAPAGPLPRPARPAAATATATATAQPVTQVCPPTPLMSLRYLISFHNSPMSNVSPIPHNSPISHTTCPA